jgi:hypothetical protein
MRGRFTFAEMEIVWLEMVIIYFKVIAREHSVDIATGYGLVGQDSIPGKGKRFISTPQYPNLLWHSPSLLYNG